MSKIDDLIRQLCPDGVPIRTVSELAKVGTGSSDKKDADSLGSYPFYVRSKEVFRSSTFEFDEIAILIPGEGGIGEIFHFNEGPYALHQRAYRVAPVAQDLDPKFLFYFMLNNFKSHILAKAVSATVTSIRKPMIESFRVAVPPLKVQREIVSILDKFTQLEAELEAELEARRVQYEETRNILLNFDQDLSSHPLSQMIRELCPEGVANVPVESLCKTYRPKTTVPRAKYLDHGVLPIVDQSQNFIAGYTDDLNAKVSVGPCVVFGDHTRERKFVDFQFAAGADGTVILIPSNLIDPKYFFFSLANLAIVNRGYNRHWTIVREMKVALPPLGIQWEIVSILDKLDTLVNDISFGLPAEIAARRKQYEYYRNKLLTFKEIDAA